MRLCQPGVKRRNWKGRQYEKQKTNAENSIKDKSKTYADRRRIGSISSSTTVIEKSIIEIGSSAFTGIKNLKTLTVKSAELTSKTLSKKAFAGITSKTTVKVPKSKLSEYKKLFRKCGLNKNVKVKAI